ncbi:aldose 1-epimerase family protein [Flammeovirga sp. SJP92]|uniref:aldose 1-epimerase family protein n=1 Tax=Flammeovirga sp. SJP92 TaxID=1775430 RepID=UPI0007869C64|nr:aldose 1-epimerase family protein [Flammeovirga sp. SJP92]KXX67691.1 hypothetical protein AVL50_24785 [Flammeovirga sp. SJP92]
MINRNILKGLLAILLASLFSSCVSKAVDKDHITLQNDFLKVMAKTHGAELTSIYSDSKKVEYLWQGDSISWADHAILQFPIVCDLKDGFYKYNNKDYPMMSHGFARLSIFETVQSSNTSVTFQLKSSEETKRYYPFDFTYEVCYTLHQNQLNVAFKVVNEGEETLYFSSGYHPGFNIPLHQDETFEDYQLTFSKVENLKSLTLKNGLISDQERDFLNNSSSLSLSKSLFKEDVFIVENPQSSTIKLSNKNNTKDSSSIEMTIENVPYLGVWSPSNESPFVCLEPWYGLPDYEDFNQDITNKKGIKALGAGEVFSWSTTMTFN